MNFKPLADGRPWCIEPMNAYRLIYADPPWSYKDKCNDGKRGASHKYACMSLDEICALPVAHLAAPDCLLAMWWTGTHIREAFQVCNAWGFTFKNATGFTWVKTYEKTGKYFFGMGHYTRGNAENVLLAVRGKPKRVCAGVSQLVIAPRRLHSQKPDAVADRLVTLMGDVPRIELFSRTERPGWDQFGTQVGKL